jgi:hypothetical protein
VEVVGVVFYLGSGGNEEKGMKRKGMKRKE